MPGHRRGTNSKFGPLNCVLLAVYKKVGERCELLRNCAKIPVSFKDLWSSNGQCIYNLSDHCITYSRNKPSGKSISAQNKKWNPDYLGWVWKGNEKILFQAHIHSCVLAASATTDWPYRKRLDIAFRIRHLSGIINYIEPNLYPLQAANESRMVVDKTGMIDFFLAWQSMWKNPCLVEMTPSSVKCLSL